MKKLIFLIILIPSSCFSIELERGMKVPDTAKYSNALIMVNSSTFSPRYLLESDGITYHLGVSGDLIFARVPYRLGVTVTGDPVKNGDTINYISTRDSDFKTQEGVRIGMTYQDLLDLGFGGLSSMPGWAQWVDLPSGWSAAFCEGSACTDVEVSPSSKIKWLFR